MGLSGDAAEMTCEMAMSSGFLRRSSERWLTLARSAPISRGDLTRHLARQSDGHQMAIRWPSEGEQRSHQRR